MFLRFIIQVMSFWFMIHFVNYALSRLRTTRRLYLNLLRKLGCSISIFHINFYTTWFNSYFYKISRISTHLWKYWFTLGIFVALTTAIGACLILIFLPLKYLYEFQQPRIPTTYNATNRNIPVETDRDSLSIQPIIPGVNVPLEQLGHFCLALLLCTVFHEFGHAVAAALEKVHINGCGYFLFIIYPGAYVDLNSEQIQMIAAYRKLRIYCAGVFHNMVLVAIAVVFLLMNPWIVRNCFSESATVYRVSKDSPVYNLLPSSSTIQSIDDCMIQTSKDWYQCLRKIDDRHPLRSTGYCLTQNEIQLLSSHIELNQTSNFDCCQNVSEKNFCFLYHSKQHAFQNGACMEARRVTNHPSCLLNSDCQRQGANVMCVQPLSIDNVTRLIRIVHNQGPPILFVGTIHEIYRTISIQSYQPKYSFAPTILITDIPLLFQYVAAFSFALAFFNAVPCYALDGQHILLALTEHLTPTLHPRRYHRPGFILIFGTCLLVVNVLIAFVRYFF